jgi:hypothetical protein
MNLRRHKGSKRSQTLSWAYLDCKLQFLRVAEVDRVLFLPSSVIEILNLKHISFFKLTMWTSVVVFGDTVLFLASGSGSLHNQRSTLTLSPKTTTLMWTILLQTKKSRHQGFPPPERANASSKPQPHSLSLSASIEVTSKQARHNIMDWEDRVHSALAHEAKEGKATMWAWSGERGVGMTDQFQGFF